MSRKITAKQAEQIAICYRSEKALMEVATAFGNEIAEAARTAGVMARTQDISGMQIQYRDEALEAIKRADRCEIEMAEMRKKMQTMSEALRAMRSIKAQNAGLRLAIANARRAREKRRADA